MKPSKQFNSEHTSANPASPADWFHHPIGQMVCQEEQTLYDDWVSNLFGYHALQVGAMPLDLLRNSRIQHCFRSNAAQPDMLCDSAFLPFQQHSLDLLLLPHVLEFSPLPQQTLREAERVLVPEGHVILTLFNPISPWGLRRMMGCGRSTIPDLWSAQFFAMPRIRDWLALLGFEVLQTRMLCHAWPIHSQKMAQRLSWLAPLGLKCWPVAGGVYAILARKRVVGMHIIKPGWQSLRVAKKLATTPNKKQISHRVKQK